MDILRNNPYRLLGVYSNSPTKERLANHNRLKAFLKVGKAVSFPLDLPQYLDPIERTEAMVADAEAQLTLPKDQLAYAQFWFIKSSPLDEVALNHLIAGDMEKAEEIWQKKECFSSLQNLIVCSLIADDCENAVGMAEILYGNTQYVEQFVDAIVGAMGQTDATAMAFDFLDTLCELVGVNEVLSCVNKEDWKNHIAEKAVKPLVDSIQDAIDQAKKTNGEGPEARLKAGKALKKSTRAALTQLGNLLGKKDLQYQMIADKLGIEILQCGIDYYNGSDEPDAAIKAMSLQEYALSIVVGKAAKDRCKKNVEILQKIIDNLPPSEVFAEDKAIKEELHRCCQRPDLICHAVTLLENTQPYLEAIKGKLGIENGYYLKISTLVVNNALSNVITEVNEAQKYDPAEERKRKYAEMREESLFERYHMPSLLYDDFFYQQEDRQKKYERMKSTILNARAALLIMDVLDMEKSFEQERYLPNRKTLNDFLIQIGAALPAYKPVSLKEKVVKSFKEENIKRQIQKSKSWLKDNVNSIKEVNIKRQIQKSISWLKDNINSIFAIGYIAFCMIIGGLIGGNGIWCGLLFSVVTLGLVREIIDR